MKLLKNKKGQVVDIIAISLIAVALIGLLLFLMFGGMSLTRLAGITLMVFAGVLAVRTKGKTVPLTVTFLIAGLLLTIFPDAINTFSGNALSFFGGGN